MQINVGGETRTIKGTTGGTKGAPRSKRPGANNGPARQRYRTKNKMMERKIRNMVKHCRMSVEKATKVWLTTRKRWK